jgi:type IV secretory pathway VirB10-like protein
MLSCKNGVMRQCYGRRWSGLLLALCAFVPPILLAASDTVLPEGTRITLQLNDHLSTKTNSEGDSFKAIVTNSVYLGDRMVIPKGSEVTGSISRIQRPGRIRGKAVMNLLFQSISIPGRGQVPIMATLVGVDPEGNSGVHSEGTVEGAGSTGTDISRVLIPSLAGTGIGSATGGGKGAGIGAGVGAAIGLSGVFLSRGKDLDIRRGSTMEIALDRPLTIPAESEDAAARNR